MIKGLVSGLHHITSISGSARNNARFYTEILGLQFVKRTVNFDSPETWHLYYGDKTGNPGSITTFFPYSGITRGKSGNKSVVSTMFSVDHSALDFWIKRFKTHQIDFRGPFQRFDEEFIVFEDFDGIQIELVLNTTDKRTGCFTAGIPSEYGIKGLFSATLSYASPDATYEFLVRNLGHTRLVEIPERIRLYSGEDAPGNYIDLIARPSVPDQIAGAGTVHHLAFNTTNEQTQEQLRGQLQRAGFHPSSMQDRQYFKSIYFREPGGVLFEVATADPGFLIDESPEELGENLRLPPWLEERRGIIEAGLAPL